MYKRNLGDWIIDSTFFGFLLDIGPFILAVLIGIFLLAGTVGKIVVETSFPADLAEIEQVRSDLNLIAPLATPGVVEQAVKINRDLANNKAYRKNWFTKFWIPARWETVEPIDFSRLQERLQVDTHQSKN